MSDKGDVDYGYGDAEPDYDYGYGDSSPDGQGKGGGDDNVDYGYGESTDYGYGDASADDYGYGDAGGADYGYGDDQAEQNKPPPEKDAGVRRGPRVRRNSCVIRKDTNNLAVAEFLMGGPPKDATPASSS